MTQTNYYYIFGIDAVLAYEELNIKEFIRKMKADSTLGILYEYDIFNMIPNEMLSEFSGWGDYREISRADYEYLKRNIYEE